MLFRPNDVARVLTQRYATDGLGASFLQRGGIPGNSQASTSRDAQARAMQAYAASSKTKLQGKDLLSLLAYQTANPNKAVTFPAQIDEPWEFGKKGRFYEQRFYFLLAELSKDPKLVARFSQQARLQWAQASAAASAMVNEIVAADPGNPAIQVGVESVSTADSTINGYKQTFDSAVDAGKSAYEKGKAIYEGGKELVNDGEKNAQRVIDSGKAAAQTVDRIFGTDLSGSVHLGEQELRGALQSGYEAAKPLLDDAAAFVSEAGGAVAADAMKMVADVTATCMPYVKAAQVAYKIAQAVAAAVVAAQDKLQSDLEANRFEVSSSLSAMVKDMDRLCQQNSVIPTSSELGRTVWPADYFRIERKQGPHHGLLGRDDVKERISDFGRALLAISTPTDVAIEVVRFINVWSKSQAKRTTIQKVREDWGQSTRANVNDTRTMTLLMHPAHDRAPELNFAIELMKLRLEGPIIRVSPWEYRRARGLVCGSDAPWSCRPDSYFAPWPKSGEITDRSSTDKWGLPDLQRFNLTDWFLSRPILHQQPVWGNGQEIPARYDGLTSLKGDWKHGYRWEYRPWDLAGPSTGGMANLVAGKRVLPHFHVWGSLFTPKGSATDFGIVCAKDGGCGAKGYDGRAAKDVDAAFKSFKSFLDKTGFSKLSDFAALGLPTRWNPVDSWFAKLVDEHPEPRTPISKDPDSMYKGRTISWYWPEKGKVVANLHPWGKDLSVGLLAPNIPSKEDGSDLVTYKVTERTRSLFRMIHRLIMEDSGERGTQGARAFPYFIDLLLYELDEGRLTDASIAALLAVEFQDGCWDASKKVRNSLYTFLQAWQANNCPISKQELTAQLDPDKLLLEQAKFAKLTALFVVDPTAAEKMLREMGNGQPLDSETLKFVADCKQRAEKRKAEAKAKAKALAFVASQRRQAAGQAADKSVGAKAKENASDKAGQKADEKNIGNLYRESSTASSGGGALGLTLLAGGLVVGGAAWYLSRKKKGK